MRLIIRKKVLRSNSKTIYKKNILDHYRNPKHNEKVEEPDLSGVASNLSCGDTLKVEIKLSEQRISKIGFEGRGCAISIASASMLTDKLVEMHIDEVKDLSSDYVLDLVGLDKNSVRVKCALLILEAIKAAIAQL
ncbi:Fe-S cluster protein [Candidatus Dojkabacteria bacterium]|nr:Fe-S cluster protein [Candidatus Dojkabacteria bacterium]